jgi:hypothetical protein
MDPEGNGRQLSRRQVLTTAGLVAVAVPLAAQRPASAALVRQADVAGAPGPEQVHVQFGAHAKSQVAVSWATPAAVSGAQLRLGQESFGYGFSVPAEVRTYTEALTGETVWTYHAQLDNLHPTPSTFTRF